MGLKKQIGQLVGSLGLAISKNLKYTAFLLTILTISLAAVIFGLPSSSVIPSSGSIRYLQHVFGDRIFDENGSEVLWRGGGGSYLLCADNYMSAWEAHLPMIEKYGFNTIRLSFRFPDSAPGEGGFTSVDTLDYVKLENVLNFLDQHDIKAILDCHNFRDMHGDFGSQKLIDDWVDLANRYRADPRIVAYELFNEPYSEALASWIQNKKDVVKAYAQLTKAIREVDPNHIIIWQSSSYLPLKFPEGFEEYVYPNIVYAVHRLYKQWFVNYRDGDIFDFWSVNEISYITANYLVEMRERFNAPFWLGEFGSKKPYNESNPVWNLTKKLLFRCEEQVISWNLWLPGKNAWKAYLPFFPLEVYNSNLTRKPFHSPVPKLTDYVIEQQGVDRYEPYRISMWHKNDFVAFRSGIVVLVITNRRLLNGTSEVLSKETVTVTEGLTIRNKEGGELGNRKTHIYPIGVA